jgi:hypothetical protein
MSRPNDVNQWNWDYLHDSKLTADEIEAGLNDGTMYVGGIDQDGMRWIRKRLGRRVVPAPLRPNTRLDIISAQASTDIYSEFQTALKSAPFNAESDATTDDFISDPEIDDDILAMSDDELEGELGDA